MKTRIKHNSNGFTIVELLIATVVFSVILLICATAIMNVGRMFYKGTQINNTQDTARMVADDISEAIQFTSDPIIKGGSDDNKEWKCIGEVRYTYNRSASRGTGSGQVRHVLWKDRPAVCSPTSNTLNLNSATPSVGISMVGNNMRVPDLRVNCSGNLCSINVTVAYGETADVFEGGSDYKKCIAQRSGGQFCAVSTITTNVGSRL